MNFLLKSKPKRTYDVKILIILGVFGFFLLLSYLFPVFFKSTAQVAMKPLWYFKEKTGTTFSFATDFISFKSSLIKENEILKDEVGRLRLNRIDYDLLFKENEELKAMLGMKKSEMKLVTNVLSKPPQSPFDTLVLSSGKDSGIEVGDKVYISDSIIVGEISDVYDQTSIAKLYSTGGLKTEVIVSRTGESFVITGAGGENFTLEVPKDTDILWGDTFIYPGNDDYILATVYYVDTNSQSSFKTINMRIAGGMNKLKRVFVGN